jgi:hypothetical protein
MMHRAGRFVANLPEFSSFASISDDRLTGELANLELGPLSLVLTGWLLGPNLGVAVAWQNGAALLATTVTSADLN